MTWKLLSLLAGVMLCGCAVIPPVGVEVANNVPRIDPAQVTALQPGSQVEIATYKARDKISGTVLQASPEGIVLINCICEHRNPGEEDVCQRRMPCHWVAIQRIDKVETIAPAPADFVAPSIEIDTNDSEVFSGNRKGIDIM